MIMPKLQAVIKITLLGSGRVESSNSCKRKESPLSWILARSKPLHAIEKAIILCSLSLDNK